MSYLDYADEWTLFLVGWRDLALTVRGLHPRQLFGSMLRGGRVIGRRLPAHAVLDLSPDDN